MKRLWKRMPRWALARRATAIGFLALLVFGARTSSRLLVGSTSASTAFGMVPFVDPLAALEVTLATRSWLPSVWIGAAGLVIAAALLGPVFCGWVCPLGFFLDLVHSLRRRLESFLARRQRRLPELSLPRSTRYAALGLALGFSLAGRIPVFQVVSPIHAVTRSFVFAADAVLIVVVVLAAVELLCAPRLWCRALCPLGGLYSLLGSRARLRIRVSEGMRRIGCRRCSLTCPMGIRVMEDYSLAGKTSIDDPDCTRCGACVDTCPRDILSICPRAATLPLPVARNGMRE